MISAILSFLLETLASQFPNSPVTTIQYPVVAESVHWVSFITETGGAEENQRIPRQRGRGRDNLARIVIKINYHPQHPIRVYN